jgi:ergothioneine biosynthesis protein EgtB
MTGRLTEVVSGVGPLARFAAVRRFTDWLCGGLEPEDLQLQPMPDASPVKWHLAHTTWFFEQFLLGPHLPNYRVFHSGYGFLFNSYYDAVGRRVSRAERGLLSRPTVRQVLAYREHVEAGVARLLTDREERDLPADAAAVLEIGLNHEQQHQELILTDLKYAFGRNPLFPVFRPPPEEPTTPAPAQTWHAFGGGLVEIGHAGGGFAFDNEGPRHRAVLNPFALAGRLTTCGEYRQFVEDAGYDRPDLWLSDGWAARTAHRWKAPLYWERVGDGYAQFTLGGQRPVADSEPVCHVSFYEADAFARWAGARLPTEQEWEHACGDRPPESGHYADDRRFHPAPADGEGLTQLFGDAWEWTASPYVGYPGYRPAAGALGEYNGKFMCNQLVLRGGSCASPRGHLRPTYRNFFPPEARWQFSGIRLCRDA